MSATSGTLSACAVDLRDVALSYPFVGSERVSSCRVDGDADDTAEAPRDSGLLSQVSTEMVQAVKRHYGKGPVSAKSYLVDDLLFVVMRDGITQAERTMLDAGRENTVRHFRQEFENEVAETLTRLVERLTGRRVINYQSQVLFDPDMTIEIFVFDDRSTAGDDGDEPAAAGDVAGSSRERPRSG